MASRAGARDAMLVADADALDFARIDKAGVIGLSAGASAPEVLVEGSLPRLTHAMRHASKRLKPCVKISPSTFLPRSGTSIMAVYTRVDEDQLANFSPL